MIVTNFTFGEKYAQAAVEKRETSAELTGNMSISSSRRIATTEKLESSIKQNENWAANFQHNITATLESLSIESSHEMPLNEPRSRLQLPLRGAASAGEAGRESGAIQ